MIRHGTYSAYTHLACRCDLCKKAGHEDYMLHRGRKNEHRQRYERANPERVAFYGARYRCSNPKNKDFKHYGGRGIRFLFQSFEEFILALGPRPSGLVLDRIDNEGHYESGNVRWTDIQTQRRNQRRSFNQEEE